MEDIRIERGEKCSEEFSSTLTTTAKSAHVANAWTWQFIDNDGVWVPYGKVGRLCDPALLPKVTSDEIEEIYSNKFSTRMLITGNTSRYELDLTKMTETNVSSGIDRPIRRYEDAKIEDGFPSYWYPMDNTGLPIKVLLSSSDREYKEQAASIWSTLPRCTIRHIYRIQSPNLYRSYINRKKLLQKWNPVIHYEEEYLFHGTDYRNVDSICSRNFDCRFNGAVHGHLYGWGVYFTNAASIAENYSSPKTPPTLQDSSLFTVLIINGATGELLWNSYSNPLRPTEIPSFPNPTGNFSLPHSTGNAPPQQPILYNSLQQPSWNFLIQQTNLQYLHFGQQSVGQQPVGYFGPHRPVGHLVSHQPVGHLSSHAPVGQLGPHQTVGHLGPHQLVGHLGSHQAVGHLVYHQTVGHSGPHRPVGHLVYHQTVGHLGPQQVVGYIGPHQLYGILGGPHQSSFGTSGLHQPTGHSSSLQSTSSCRPLQPISSTRPQQPILSNRPQQQTSSSRPKQPNSSSSHQQPTSFSHLQQPISSSRPQQMISSSSYQQPTSSFRPQQPTSSSRPQQPILSNRPQQQTSSSRPKQPTSSSSHPQPTSFSHLQQLISSSRPQQRISSSSLQQPTSSFQPQQPTLSSRPQQPILSSRPRQLISSTSLQQPTSSSHTQQLISFTSQHSRGLSRHMPGSSQQPNAIIIAKVLIGRLCEGHPNLTKPVTDAFGLPTDTAADRRAHPRIFVKFNDQEYYPEYYVEFE